MIYQIVKALYEEKRMRVYSSCKLLEVSRSGYYKWRNKMPAKTQLEEQHCVEITKAWEASGKTYGSPRIYRELRSKGITISEKKVA